VPTQIGRERLTNPFLRSHRIEVKERVNKMTGASVESNLACFTAMRIWKNGY
jgi:hypothetical protein